MFGVVISSMHFGRGLFCYSNIIISILTINNKKIWWSETVTVLLTSPNVSFNYKKLLQTFRKNICLVKEFFFINLFIGIFWGILRQFSQHFPRKTPLFFCTFSIILSIYCRHLVVYYLTKALWNYVRAI